MARVFEDGSKKRGSHKIDKGIIRGEKAVLAKKKKKNL